MLVRIFSSSEHYYTDYRVIYNIINETPVLLNSRKIFHVLKHHNHSQSLQRTSLWAEWLKFPANQVSDLRKCPSVTTSPEWTLLPSSCGERVFFTLDWDLISTLRSREVNSYFHDPRSARSWNWNGDRNRRQIERD